MSYQYSQAIVIGRFQPFHNQHAELIKQAAKLAPVVYVLIGGDDKPRTPKDPFTGTERAHMILHWAADNNLSDVVVACPTPNYMYSNALWAENIQSVVSELKESISINKADPGSAVDRGTVLVGCNKDSSSFYLSMFPQWTLHEVPYSEKVDATIIRDLMFDSRSLNFVQGVVPPSVYNALVDFTTSECFQLLKQERAMIQQYKEAWSVAPYAPTFVTADAVVIQSGHVLMVRRGASPGKGLLALPGGFLDQNETVVDAIIRELREETRIKVPAPVLKGSIKDQHYFDHPDRSARGRTITHAALIVLPNGPLPKVKGGDDAAWAGWIPLSEIKGSLVFEDHKDIIDYFKSRF